MSRTHSCKHDSPILQPMAELLQKFYRSLQKVVVIFTKRATIYIIIAFNPKILCHNFYKRGYAMMQKEKIIQRSLFLAVAAASLVAAPAAVRADGETTTTPTGTLTDAGITNVEVDGVEGVLTATSGANEVLVGTGKVNAKKATITVSTWDIYEPEGGSITVDLSKLKNTADNYLVLGTNKNENVSIVKIPVAAKVTKLKFDAAKAVLQAGYGASSKEATLKELKADDADAAKFEYRTSYSQWKDMVKDSKLPDFKLYQVNGSQLYVRLKGAAEAQLTQPDDKEKLAYNGQETQIPVYVAPNLPGKEVKVSIAAKAKGPSITADYVNSAVKLPKSTEWRLATATEIVGAAASAAAQDTTTPTPEKTYLTTLTDGKAHSITEILTAANKTDLATAALEVRKAKTDKKPASKWSRLTIEKLATLKAGDGNDYVEGTISDTGKAKKPNGQVPAATTEKQEYEGEGIKNAKVFENGTQVITIEYATTGSKSNLKNVFKVTNKGKLGYEIRIGAKDAAEAPTTGKSTKIASGASREKIVTVKSVDDLSTVWIRRAGDKKTKTWASAWAKLGVVDYPYVVEAQTPPTTGGNTQTGGNP